MLIGGFCRFDPDILVGYEVQMHSWGYLLQRAAVLGADLCQQLSRVPGSAAFYRAPSDSAAARMFSKTGFILHVHHGTEPIENIFFFFC